MRAQHQRHAGTVGTMINVISRAQLSPPDTVLGELVFDSFYCLGLYHREKERGMVGRPSTSNSF